MAAGNASSVLACLHVRREDKTGQPIYLLPGPSYYERAKAELKSHLHLDGRELAFAVTAASRDDMEWARHSFERWEEPVHMVDSAGPLDDFVFLQVACDALVLTASSFGWWAAFTSELAKVVVAPRVIVNPQDPLSFEFRREDYYPESWILINPF